MKRLEALRRKQLTWPRPTAQQWGDDTFIPSSVPIMRGASGWEERGDRDFDGYVSHLLKSCGPVFACTAARMLPFSEARLLMQELRDGRPSRLYDHASLELLEQPWPNATTGDLLSRMELDASGAGNFYATRVAGRIRRLRPNFVRSISGVRDDPEASSWAIDAELLGYIYDTEDGRPPVWLSPDAVVHYAPIPDPAAQWRGMSWMTPLLNEIAADKHATIHKRRFFEKGATLGTIISYDKSVSPRQFKEYVRLFEENHRGSDNAYETLHVGGGADPKVTGATMQQLDFKLTQGAGETRIAAAAGVGAVIAQLSEGLAGSSLNTGNYGAAKRRFGDMLLRPLWRSACGSLAKFAEVPDGSRLWYDARDVEFLKEDRKDAAAIQSQRASTIKSLVDAGYSPDSVVRAVESEDFNLLEHSGLYSVQLQEAGGTPLGKQLTRDQALGVLRDRLKVGARNSAQDLALIQAAHDAIVGAGAACTLEEDA